MSIEGMHLSRIVELEGKLAEARKDTARLDWLQHAVVSVLVCEDRGIETMIDWENTGSPTFREAIDAAREEN